MKNIVLIFAITTTLLFSSFVGNAQKKEYSKKINQTIGALFDFFDSKKIEDLEPYLDPELSVSGQKKSLTPIILKSIAYQVSIGKQYFIQSVVQDLENWDVTVEMELNNEKKTCSFTLNKDYKFLTIDLLKVQVKKGEDTESPKLETSITIPFTTINNLIVCDLYINGNTHPAKFIFDTGATATVIDSTFAAKNNITSLTSQNVAGAAGNKEYKMTKIDQVLVNEKLKLNKVTGVIIDMNKIKQGNEFQGIIGRDLLQNYVTAIDYDRSEITFYNAANESKIKYQNVTDITFDNSIPIPHLNFDIQLDENQSYSGKVLMDTGANLNFMFNSKFIESKKGFTTPSKTFISEASGFTKKSKTKVVQSNHIKILDHTFSTVPVTITDSKTGVNSFPGLIGILGNRILKNFNWMLDYKEMKLYYQKNDQYKPTANNIYAAFDIEDSEGKLQFKNVQHDSKAYQKGIRNGSTIKQVNGFGVTEIDEIKELMQKENNKLNIVYYDSNQVDKTKVFKVRTKSYF